jgi:hypothetical protein
MRYRFRPISLRVAAAGFVPKDELDVSTMAAFLSSPWPAGAGSPAKLVPSRPLLEAHH